VRVLLAAALLAAACSSPPALHDAGSPGGGSGTAGGTGGSAGAATAGGNTAGGASTATIIHVHYPAGAQAITLRGSAAGLSWTSGQATTSTATDEHTLVLSNLSGSIEWKPVLGATWALGPNYHVAPGETVDVWPHFTTMSGQVATLISAFHSNLLGNDRAIYAYLPPTYAENPTARFPVVYMHDGQNLWAALPQLAFGAPWNVDTTFDLASRTGACSSATAAGWGAQPLGGMPMTCTGDGDCPSGACRTFPEAIVIGVANNAARIAEYTPTMDSQYPGSGNADLYLRMLVEELKPVIDGMLRTRPSASTTVIAGSSLGGLVSAYAGLRHPTVFGRVAALSPSTWWDSRYIVGAIQGTGVARPLTVYLDSGSPNDGQADTDLLANAYLALGYVDGVSFRHVVQPGGMHNEVFWAQRFPGAMQLVLGVR
jgi:predicted alpha/beta superfamily hydrolase